MDQLIQLEHAELARVEPRKPIRDPVQQEPQLLLVIGAQPGRALSLGAGR